MTNHTRNTVRRRRASEDRLSELQDLCHDIHRLLYLEDDLSAAHDLLEPLQRAIERLPGYLFEVRSDTPIRHEALALCCELRGDWEEAIQHRQQELAMLEQLTEDDMRDGWVFRTTGNRTFLLSDFSTDLIADRVDHLRALREKRSAKTNEEQASSETPA